LSDRSIFHDNLRNPHSYLPFCFTFLNHLLFLFLFVFVFVFIVSLVFLLEFKSTNIRIFIHYRNIIINLCSWGKQYFYFYYFPGTSTFTCSSLLFVSSSL
jgi:hypothetical protein